MDERHGGDRRTLDLGFEVDDRRTLDLGFEVDVLPDRHVHDRPTAQPQPEHRGVVVDLRL